MSLNVHEQVRLEVSFCSDRPGRAQTKMVMCLEDNKHITTTVQVTAEACQEVVSFHHISRSSQETDLDVDEGKKTPNQQALDQKSRDPQTVMVTCCLLQGITRC